MSADVQGRVADALREAAKDRGVTFRTLAAVALRARGNGLASLAAEVYQATRLPAEGPWQPPDRMTVMRWASVLRAAAEGNESAGRPGVESKDPWTCSRCGSRWRLGENVDLLLSGAGCERCEWSRCGKATAGSAG